MADIAAPAASVRLMLSCDNCRKKKVRCNGGHPECTSCMRGGIQCHYSPVGPRKKPRRPAETASASGRIGQRQGKRRATGAASDSDESSSPSLEGTDDKAAVGRGLGSVSHLMLERLREAETLELPSQTAVPTAKACAVQQQQQQQSSVMEMLRLQTQISGLVDQLRNITIQVSGMTPADSPAMPPAGFAPAAPAAIAEPADKCSELHLSKPEHARGVNVSRDLINHLISVYFQFCHPTETGMYPTDLYRDRLQRAQVSETFLLSVLAVASRLSDDPRVKREPAYLAGYDFFERVTRGLMMDVLERDCVENMLTLNNLAVYAVGLPVANRGWYFSGLAMRMATQMSLQKVDAPGRMPGASMMSAPGIESARRAFWTTLLLEALASFASGEPPPVTNQDVHVAEPFDGPSLLGDDSSAKPAEPTPNAYIAQLAMLLIRVARLNGNRHPESAQFSPEYAALHSEMVTWYRALPENMQIRSSVAKSEILGHPQLFAAKMFVHCHYHAAIIALHQPRVDLVRVDTAVGA
ncbi:hypothetical protein GGI02_000952 [Coemansia sp. RSA 2322]|nr:hypothetical protein GGI02_000952 [Coemansia sp. RSA 2322]